MSVVVFLIMKITEILRNNEAPFSFSFEVTPNVSKEDLESIDLEPTFYSITWHAKSHLCTGLDIPPLKFARWLRKKKKLVLMHLSCDLMRCQFLDEVLVFLKEIDVCNLFIVLGEKFDVGASDFQSTNDIISYIRSRTGDYFCIGVAGYPASKTRLINLKEKINSGADFIITQAFFEVQEYLDFVAECKNNQIYSPIIPGIFLFEKLHQIDFFTNLTKIKVSDEFIKTIQEKEITEKEPGLKIVKNNILALKAAEVKCFHFFTLNNLRKVMEFIKTF